MPISWLAEAVIFLVTPVVPAPAPSLAHQGDWRGTAVVAEGGSLCAREAVPYSLHVEGGKAVLTSPLRTFTGSPLRNELTLSGPGGVQVVGTLSATGFHGRLHGQGCGVTLALTK